MVLAFHEFYNFGRSADGNNFEFHQIFPIVDPTLEQNEVFGLHHLPAGFEMVIDPARNVVQAFRHHPALFAQSLVNCGGILEPLDYQVMHQAKLDCLGEQKRIENFPVFDHVISQSSFKNEAGFLQNACGSGIVRMRHGEKPVQREFFEAIVYKRGDDFAHDALPQNSSASQYPNSAVCRWTSSPGRSPIPPTAALPISIQKFFLGKPATEPRRNSFASSIV